MPMHEMTTGTKDKQKKKREDFVFTSSFKKIVLGMKYGVLSVGGRPLVGSQLLSPETQKVFYLNHCLGY